MKLRKTEKVEVTIAHTEKYKNSAVPFMQRLINEHEQKKKNEISSRGHQKTTVSDLIVPCKQ